MSITSTGLYLILNLIFLVREGVTTEPGGGLRVMLFLLVFLTIALSTLVIATHNMRSHP